jgi:hypothetical protein
MQTHIITDYQSWLYCLFISFYKQCNWQIQSKHNCTKNICSTRSFLPPVAGLSNFRKETIKPPLAPYSRAFQISKKKSVKYEKENQYLNSIWTVYYIFQYIWCVLSTIWFVTNIGPRCVQATSGGTSHTTVSTRACVFMYWPLSSVDEPDRVWSYNSTKVWHLYWHVLITVWPWPSPHIID